MNPKLSRRASANRLRMCSLRPAHVAGAATSRTRKLKTPDAGTTIAGAALAQ
jgi:hypothetical protein